MNNHYQLRQQKLLEKRMQLSHNLHCKINYFTFCSIGYRFIHYLCYRNSTGRLQKRNALRELRKRWTNNIIPYTLSSDFSKLLYNILIYLYNRIRFYKENIDYGLFKDHMIQNNNHNCFYSIHIIVFFFFGFTLINCPGTLFIKTTHGRHQYYS